MQLSDFDYHLPSRLIAQYPLEKRIDSRLLVANGNNDVIDSQFKNISEFLQEGDLLVLNDSKVLPVRIYGHRKQTRGNVEILVVKIINSCKTFALLKANNHLAVGNIIQLNDTKVLLRVVDKKDYIYTLNWYLDKYKSVTDILNELGQMPLPPYIKRSKSNKLDYDRYQSIFASNIGSIAAPTAGFHFDNNLLNTLKTKGIKYCFITHHVGLATFQPIKVENITAHKLAKESYFIGNNSLEQIKQVQTSNSRIIAVGTTSVRCLEYAFTKGDVLQQGESSLFIYPGFKFSVIDGMITNFHIPKSTLFMLVSAYKGLDSIKKLYSYAIDKEYRFYSYGDSMLLLK